MKFCDILLNECLSFNHFNAFALWSGLRRQLEKPNSHRLKLQLYRFLPRFMTSRCHRRLNLRINPVFGSGLPTTILDLRTEVNTYKRKFLWFLIIIKHTWSTLCHFRKAKKKMKKRAFEKKTKNSLFDIRKLLRAAKQEKCALKGKRKDNKQNL